MPVDRSQDTPARLRLEALVNRLSDAQLATRLSDDWTVAAVLAHLSFWDQRAAYLVRHWQKEGVGNSGADADPINNAAKPQWLALPPRVAADLAVQAARAADAALDTCSPELLERIQKAGSPINLNRATHRFEHLAEIEAAIGK